VTAQSLPTLATVLILVSALVHATVNALVKVSADALLTRGLMNAAAFVLAMFFLPFVEPPSGAMWKILVLAVLVHGLYPFFLVTAYRHGDLSVAFPVARGIVPVAVAGGTLAFTEFGPSPQIVPFLLLVSLGIGAFSFERFRGRGNGHAKSIAFAILTGLIVAAYTLIDSIGLRAAPAARTYIVWLLLLDGLFVSTVVALLRRNQLRGFVALHWKKNIATGILGILTYVLALAALSIGNPAEIAALRETSIVFAAIIGFVFLRERFGNYRIAATVLVLAGIAGMKLAA
jgi:drug/metabolite transporter (DMT)-like permease